ncbi:hypothetical protein SESBI_03143 [Sesbania bispinosa]|nr:hypothetical protein SESBI_03143 [Sesbania bispinosa]
MQRKLLVPKAKDYQDQHEKDHHSENHKRNNKSKMYREGGPLELLSFGTHLYNIRRSNITPLLETLEGEFLTRMHGAFNSRNFQ